MFAIVSVWIMGIARAWWLRGEWWRASVPRVVTSKNWSPEPIATFDQLTGLRRSGAAIAAVAQPR